MQGEISSWDDVFGQTGFQFSQFDIKTLLGNKVRVLDLGSLLPPAYLVLDRRFSDRRGPRPLMQIWEVQPKP